MPAKNESLPDCLYSAAQVRELDRIAIQDLRMPGYGLMQGAAAFSYEVLKKHWPDANSIVVICGGGNNAGDGYVLTRLALDDNKQVSLVNLFDPAKLKGDAATAYKDINDPNKISATFSKDLIEQADVIVDAVFGTGLDRNIEGELSDVIAEINASATPVMSIDIPSGLNADTGVIMNQAVDAEITATFIGLKQGMFTADGLQCCGGIEFNRLDVPDEAYQRLGEQSALRLRLSKLNSVLAPRTRNSHKGHYGHVLIVGGDSGYLGAARMAAEASARVGAGLVSIATRATHASQLSIVRPEIMSHAVETLDELMPLIERVNVIAVGPGLGQSEWARLLLARILELSLPLVIDADALNLLAEEHQASRNWIITPHPGEAARLLNTDTNSIQSDRFYAAKMLHEQYKANVVLKGSGTVIADSKGQLSICDAGNPGMSSGGMGDVLTGVLAGLIAQGLERDLASKLGVCLHAQAADRAASINGERGLMAMDLMPHLRNLVNP